MNQEFKIIHDADTDTYKLYLLCPRCLKCFDYVTDIPNLYALNDYIKMCLGLVCDDCKKEKEKDKKLEDLWEALKK